MAAPIHKLLLAHAMVNQVVAPHVQGVVKDYAKHALTYAPVDDPDGPQTTLSGRVIVRHGAGPNFKQFFAGNLDAADHLAWKQKLLAEEYDRPLWSLGENRLKAWPPKLPAANERIPEDDRKAIRDVLKHRAPHARRVVDLWPGISGHVDTRDEGFLLRHSGARPAAFDQLPSQLFGFPLTPKSYDNDVQDATAFGGGPKGDDSVTAGPGMLIVGATAGRLGPIVTDNQGNYFALTAKHVLDVRLEQPTSTVLDGRGRRIGRVVDVSSDVASSEDIGLIALERPEDFDLAYGGFEKIVGAASDDAAYGTEAVIAQGHQVRRGYVSGTDMRVRFTVREPMLVSDMIRVSPEEDAPFAQIGDSGAPVVDDKGGLIGMVICGTDRDVYVKPVGRYLEARELSFARKLPDQTVAPEPSPVIHHYQQGMAAMARTAMLEGQTPIIRQAKEDADA